MKKAHIISHTHWDREWYLPYETHHMRLIMLIDQILEAIDNDVDFNSFHLDGQTICIDDYLQVKPQNREKLMKAIQEGKIKIGPWYILQDAFLTSAEANVRNGYYGNLDCIRYGKKTSVGYYPDTFGIYSQAPQILSELEIDNMIFGRGVSTTGFNNEVSNQFESKYSEMNIRGSDGSEVLGILFANWYSNGNEIPVDKEEAKKYWDQKLFECERYTNSNHLLFMNGCDHTPYQANVTLAIKVANELYPDIEFVHSSFDQYLSEIKSDNKVQELTTIGGELTSQTTDGYYTLVNTASSRINQKILNARIQDKYQYLVEPIAALYSEEYKHCEIEYGWKTLMKNHPHDSICGCSVDSVHRSVDMRFEDSENIANFVIDEALLEVKEQVTTTKKHSFVLVNPSVIANSNHKVIVEYEKQLFGSDFRAARDKMKAIEIPNLGLFTSDGQEVPAKVNDLGISFDYILPDDKFRIPYYSRNIEIEFSYEFSYIGHETFYLKEIEESEDVPNNQAMIENQNLKLEVNVDGKVTITDKKTGKSQNNLIQLFDQGDIGNEYMFGRVKDDKKIYFKDINTIENKSNNVLKKLVITGEISVPQSADETLKVCQQEIIEYNVRNCKRNKEHVSMPVEIIFELGQYDLGVKTIVNIDNVAQDHRMRVAFKLTDSKNTHIADSAFENVNRSKIPLTNWQNPSFDQRLGKFVKLQSEDMDLTIATMGLHEYEIIDDTVEITMLRSTGELGDWGYFPTPEAQCQYRVSAEMYVAYNLNNERDNVNNICRSIFVKQPSIQLEQSSEDRNLSKKMLDVKCDSAAYISTIKKSVNDELIIRFGSNGKRSKITTTLDLQKTNMLETKTQKLEKLTVNANQILTVKVKG